MTGLDTSGVPPDEDGFAACWATVSAMLDPDVRLPDWPFANRDGRVAIGQYERLLAGDFVSVLDAPTPSGFWHWGVVDLPPVLRSLPEGVGEGDEVLSAGRHITNDAGLRRYVGAAPPLGPAHRYCIVVTALDIPTVDLPGSASPALTLFQTLGNTVARATLVPR